MKRIEFCANSTGKYLNRISDFLKAFNTKLWQGSSLSEGLNGQTLHIPNADKYKVLAVNYALDDQMGILTKQDSGIFSGSENMQYPTFMTAQAVTLTPIGEPSENNYRLTCEYTRIDSTGSHFNITEYGIKSISGVVPMPEKFGLGGV